jgi:hypothetical protein
MNRIVAALMLSLAMASAQAMPIVFTSTSYTTFALADVDGTLDTFDASSPPDPLPITSSASVTVDGGSATAEATADSLSLTASTDASSTGGVASASAVATFLGEFTTPGGLLSLLADFEDTTITGGTGLAGSLFAISLVVDGSTLFDQSFFSTELIDSDFPVPAGLPGTLEIVLISSVLSSVDGDAASNLATASFALDAAAVPEPDTLALVFAGLGLLGLGRGFGARDGAP